MIHHCREMAAATDLPVSADLEKGKGDSPESAGETIFAAAAAGLAGCSIEDHSGDPDRSDLRFQPRRRARGGGRRRGPLAEARFHVHRACRELSCGTAPTSTTPSAACRPSKRPAPTCSMRRGSPTSRRSRRSARRCRSRSTCWWCRASPSPISPMPAPSASRSAPSSPPSSTACCRPRRARCCRTAPSASPVPACRSARCRNCSPEIRQVKSPKLGVVDMHTGGEPVRIVIVGLSGDPEGHDPSRSAPGCATISIISGAC